MHAKYQRRVPHLEQALLVKRAPADPSGFILTGPITITVIETASAHSLDLNTATTSSTKSTEASVTSTSTSSSTRLTPLPTSTTTFFVKVTKTPPPPPTQIPPSSTAVPSPSIAVQNTALKTPQSQSLSSGAIAGIVIACLFVLVAAVVFGMRRRFMYHRRKIRCMWTTSKAIGIPPTSPFEPQEYPGTIRPYPFPVPSSSTGNNRTKNQFLNVPSSSGTYFAGAQAASRQAAAQGPSMTSVLAPPASYGAGFGSQILTTTIPNSPFASSDAPFGATVIYTFITSLPDELSITVGETIRVLAEYDDGWALSLNTRGEQGMVPLQCLDRGVGGGRSFDGDGDMDGMRRVSSLNAFRR